MGRSRLKVILAEMDISQKELAAKTGLARNTISAIVNGERTPHIDSAHRIARALGVHINKLFPGLFTYSQIRRKSL